MASIPAFRPEAEAEDLKGAAWLEDLHLWQMASWREGDKVRHVHLGSCRKVDHETALQKARKLKAEVIGISEN